MLNLPNTITILRILSIPAFVICLLYGYSLSALLLFVGAGVTDALDGFIARVFNQKTILGSYLDPIADKLLLTAAFIGLAILGIIPSWLTVIVITRDIIILMGILILVLTSHRVEMNPTFISKSTTTFQLVTIICALLMPHMAIVRGLLSFLIWVTTLLTCASGFHYIYIGSKLFNEKGG